MPEPASEPTNLFDPSLPELHQDMSPADIIAMLEAMPFTDGHGLIRIDRGIRDYLLNLLRRR